MDKAQPAHYEFGPFRLYPFERLLLRAGEPVPLRPRAFDTLLVLLRNRGRLMGKDELIRLIWRGSIVEEGNLTHHIFMIRKMLGESPADHQYIVTIPGEGYRFVAKVKEVMEGEEADAQSPARPAPRAAPTQAAIKSLAVLPLKRLGASNFDKHLGVGIADVLITKLSYIKRILVRPTTAVLRYAGVKTDPTAAGRELGVDAVLDGTVQLVGERVRVNVQLLSVSTDTILWAEKFDEDFTNIFAVQDAISEQVARSLLLRLSGDEREMVTRIQTENIEAYQLYVMGRYFWDQRTEQGLKKGVEYAEKIIALDPNYVSAYVGLADSYSFLGEYLCLAPSESFTRAKEAALKALQIDPGRAEPHAALAEVKLFYDWDWAGAEQGYKRAIEINPNYASALHYYAWFLMMRGRFEEALLRIKQAQRVDPGALVLNTALGLPFYYSRDYKQAIKHYRQTIELDAQHVHAHYYLGAALAQQGLFAEALASFHEHRRLWAGDFCQQNFALTGYTHAVAGDRAKALRVLGRLHEEAERRYISPYCLAIVHAGLRDKEQALRELERAYREHAAWMVLLNVDPWFEGIRAERRFKKLLRLVGFEP